MSIREIAKKAGVSTATVSRVINDPQYITKDPKVRERVLRLAREMNYVPNEAARNLKMNRGGVDKVYFVNILVTRTESGGVDPFFSELIHFVESEIHKNNCMLSNIWYHSFFSDDRKCETENIGVRIEKMYENQSKTDGLIIIGKCNERALELLKGYCREIVSINRNSTNYAVDEVNCDGEKIAAMAVNYLISLGHRQIAYVGGCQNEARFWGYQHALQEHGIAMDESLVVETRQSANRGYEIMEHIMKGKKLPTAIYCANDIIAVGMLKYLQLQGKHFPHPSIISSDDINAAQLTKPMLTTVHLPKEDMAKCAIWLLLDRLRGGHKAVIQMDIRCQLMVRSSCQPPDAEDFTSGIPLY